MHYELDVSEDYVRSLARSSITAVRELIWNAIDADATKIRVELARNELDGVEAIIVKDDGHGISPGEAADSFGHLGGSWKASKKISPGGRPLHGRLGSGRFSVFRHGGTARWESVYEEDGTRRRMEIRIGADSLISTDALLGEPTDAATGTTVVVEGFSTPPMGLIGEGAIDTLTTAFAVPLIGDNLTVHYDGNIIDPAPLIDHDVSYSLETDDDNATLRVIEWKQRDLTRRIYLCNTNGVAIESVDDRIQAPGFKFTAYLSWTGFEDLGSNVLTLELSDGPGAALVERAREQLRSHFKTRAKERQRETVDAWKAEDVYPFESEPTTTTEVAVRDTFDLVAVHAASVINQGPASARRLSLRLMKESLERDPTALHHVLEEVLALPVNEIDELSALLKQSPFSSIIKIGRTVADRSTVLASLTALVTDPEWKKRLLERSQLHKILERESWLFGEEYALTLSDRSLDAAMRQHIELLGRADLVDIAADGDELTDDSGTRRILDLMFTTTVKRHDDVSQHLVVELKRPSVNVKDAELGQIKNYARALASHDQFDAARTKWEFWVVSTSVSDTVEAERNQPNREPGVAFEDPERRYIVKVKRWAEILHDARLRLKFLEDHLIVPSNDEALTSLRERHAEVLG